MKRVAFIGSGLALFLFGLFGAFFGLLSIADPVGAQMANDSDPLGDPPTLVKSIAITAMYLALTVIGGWLFKRGQRVSLDAT